MSAAAQQTAVVILAAGQGTRMKSRRAKVLHEICGLPMLAHVHATACAFGAARLLVVVGRDAEQVQATFAGRADFVLQAEQRGTGHAVMVTEAKLHGWTGDVLILYGDTPLLRAETLERMRSMKRDSGADLVMLTASGDIPGRVVRDAEGRVLRIVEAQDASEAELAIEERNTGVYLISSELLWAGLATLDTGNRQGELYLTDVVGHAVREGFQVEALWLEDGTECLGINTRAELARAARVMQRRINEGWMARGVGLLDPDSTYIDARAEIGADTLVEPGCFISGHSVIGRGCHIKANSYIEESRLDDDVVFGPFAHLRPNCHLMTGVKIGNFVELKNSRMGPGSKSAHLSYIGDATVGAEVNFGCGSVVVNYDGYAKHHSTIGDHAFIGCNVNLISPVELAPHSFVAAGSTINLDVPEDALAVARARQRNIEGWVARKEGRAPALPAAAAVEGVAATTPTRAVRKKPVKKKPAKKSGPKKPSKASGPKSAGKPPSGRKPSARKKARTEGTRRKVARKRATRRR